MTRPRVRTRTSAGPTHSSGIWTARARELAYAVSEGVKGFGVNFDVALLHLALGERDQALAALERAVDDGSQMIGYINVDPALDPIRSEPRVRVVARKIGLA